MKLKPYKEILAMAKEKVDDMLAPVRAKKAKKKAELKIAELEEQITTKESKVFEICAEKELDFDLLIRTQDEVAILERKKKQFERIIDELFPE